MKFTKEQLKEALKAKLTVNGRKTPLTDRTLQSQSETLYKFATEETELADFVSTIYPSIEGLEGQYRKDYSDFTKDYRDWETDRKSTRLNSSHSAKSRMPSSA